MQTSSGPLSWVEWSYALASKCLHLCHRYVISIIVVINVINKPLSLSPPPHHHRPPTSCRYRKVLSAQSDGHTLWLQSVCIAVTFMLSRSLSSASSILLLQCRYLKVLSSEWNSHSLWLQNVCIAVTFMLSRSLSSASSILLLQCRYLKVLSSEWNSHSLWLQNVCIAVTFMLSRSLSSASSILLRHQYYSYNADILRSFQASGTVIRFGFRMSASLSSLC